MRHIIVMVLLPLQLLGQYGTSGNYEVKVDKNNNTVIINIGGSQHVVLKGKDNQNQYVEGIIKRLDQVVKQLENGEAISKETLNNLQQQTAILILIAEQINDYKLTTVPRINGYVERLIYNFGFFEAASILKEQKPNAKFNALKKLADRLHYYNQEYEKYYIDKRLLLAAIFLDSIKIIGNEKIDLSIWREKSDKLQEVIYTSANKMILLFDKTNCVTCPFPVQNSQTYRDIFDWFKNAYNLPADKKNITKWINRELIPYLNTSSNSISMKHLHAEVLYRFCFMLYYDFSKIRTKVYNLDQAHLSSIIELSVKNSSEFGKSKKQDLLKVIRSH